MFAHCLLPALLFLAAVDAFTSSNTAVVTRKLPPYKVTKIAGSKDHVILYHKMQFYIPDGKCGGKLNMAKKDGLRCDNVGFIGWVNVTVLDYRPRIKIQLHDQLNVVEVIRPKDCSKIGLVSIHVGCILLYKDAV